VRRGASTVRFHACALCRTRKLCRFYVRVRDDGSVDTAKSTMHEAKPLMLDHAAVYKRSVDVRAGYCRTVKLRETGTSLWYSPSEALIYDGAERKAHAADDVGPLTTSHLNAPTRILPTLAVDEQYGQYWFADSITTTLLKHVQVGR